MNRNDVLLIRRYIIFVRKQMSKNRLINTTFWNDSWIINLDPIERYLFLYLLTNEHTNIAGIYELPIIRMAQETGLDKEMLPKILKRFEENGKVFYVDNWVLIKNFSKHQKSNSEKVKIGIQKQIEEIPDNILEAMDRVSIGYHILKPKSKPKSKPKPKLNNAVKPQDIVNYFFELKGWANKDKEFYQKNKIIYARFTKPAKELLELCDGNLDEAKECLDKISTWAKSHDLEWGIETVFKKWYDLDVLKPKEKKPYIDGKRAFERNGKWYLIERNGEIKEYVGDKKNIEYK